MKSRMAENSEYFSIGSTVRIVTCHNVEMRGEVVAFDVGTKFLILSILFFSICRSLLNDKAMSHTQTNH